MQSPTFSEVCEIEPRVGAVIEAAKIEPDPWWPEYSEYKARLSNLVGWGAPPTADERLRTSAAYMTCINTLVEALNL